MGQLAVFTLSILFAFVEVANARQVHTPTPNVPSQTTHLHSLAAVTLALLLASSCCTELVSFRPPPLHKCNVSGPAKQPDRLADNSELLDMVLLASVDGKLHALNRTTGHTLWSMSSFSSSSSTTVSPPSSLAPLTYIIEPRSGDIYVLAFPHSRSAPLQRFPYSIPELVDMSPFTFATADDHRVFVGRKATAEVVVELETGEVRFGGANTDTCPWGLFPDLDERDECEPLPKRREVVVGRTDYHVTIHTRPSNGRKLVPVQTLAFSTYGPSGQDNILQGSYRSTKDGVYMQSLPNGELLAFITGSKEDLGVCWGREFKSPIVAIFDVLRSPARDTFFILLQPRPRLYTILRNLVRATSMDHLDSVYLGLVEAMGSLFAMSPGRFPLVAVSGAGQGRVKLETALAGGKPKQRLYGSEDEDGGRGVFGSVLAAVSGRDAPARGRGRG
ncbi:hypothetical protein B0H14DRAFT_3577815 [Mycena olivaceomarginata]|nr:hypothetical protein B0H14DRAFT_3577815 [Mycena olivaceomarginata]